MAKNKQLFLFSDFERYKVKQQKVKVVLHQKAGELIEEEIKEDLKLILGEYASFDELIQKFNQYDFWHLYEGRHNPELDNLVDDAVWNGNCFCADGYGFELPLKEIHKKMNEAGIKHFSDFSMQLYLDGIYIDKLFSESHVEPSQPCPVLLKKVAKIIYLSV